MSKLALYQKYRSSNFDEVVGQEYIVQSIRNAISHQKISHAYLFCGPRGTGKTTMARILAKAVNCLDQEHAPCEQCENCVVANEGTHPDIVEINAANETHVEDIRALIDRARLAPMQGKYRIYIVDEVHQLSSAASSALLKTLEEPPEHVIFILATTDPQKLLPTIISRCQRYDFTRVKKEQIKNHLLNIAEKEKIQMEEEAAEMIAVLSDGGMRDALSIMDQCAAYTADQITLKDLENIYGLTSTDEKISLLEDIVNEDVESVMNRMQAYDEKGVDIARYTEGFIQVLKDLIIYKKTQKPALLKTLNEDQAKKVLTYTTHASMLKMLEKMVSVKDNYRNTTSALQAFEIACLSLMVEQSEELQDNSKQKKVTTAKKEEAVLEKTAKEAPVQKEEGKLKESTTISTDDLLSILVQCNKNEKASAEEAMNQLNELKGPAEMRYTSLLKQSSIGASGKDCLILVTSAQAIANRINDEVENKALYHFMKEKLNIDKMIYAVTKQDFTHATSEYRSRMAENNLPSPRVIERYATEQNEEMSQVEKIQSIFGKENVEIIGE